MKTPTFPRFYLLASILLLAVAGPAHAIGSVEDVDECKAQADQFGATRVTRAGLANYLKSQSSNILVAVDYLKLNATNQVPVLTLRGLDDVTLIVLIHKKAGSTDETPDIDAICHDQNHAFTIDKAKKTISFASDDFGDLYLRFRLDKATLPDAHWKDPAADSVEMSPIASATSKPKTNAPLWCGPPEDKHVTVDGKDMWFKMCKHFGATRFYKYTIRMDVKGSPVAIDPIIVHEPQ